MKRQLFALAAMAAAMLGANERTANMAPATAQQKASTTKPASQAPQTDSTQSTAQATQPRVLRQRPIALGGPVNYFRQAGQRLT
ncbi:hypothetical protein GCM10022409_45120 [Hymenobacter glaciei]|uniref:Uncharacterized protein n=1 Tax=Hymenobacter glaciei TaxID=877209 RepID=A0ABP7UUB6_9BACT